MRIAVASSQASPLLEELLGNPETVFADGQPVTLEDALGDAEFLALCFSASYCPSCRLFVPALEYASSRLEERCKVLLIGGDKTRETFDTYRVKYPHFLTLSFEATQAVKTTLRERWSINTIPHVVLLERYSAKVVHSNIRFQIEENPRCDGFPWTGQSATTTAPIKTTSDEVSQRHWSLAERVWKKPRFYQLGHFASAGSTKKMYMDENAVRARAGLLNITSWMAMMNLFFWRESMMLYVLWPIVAWDMVSAALFGLTPLSPYGMLGTVLAYTFGPAEPHWKPASPKRFAWIIGFFLVNTCGLGYVLKLQWLMVAAVLMCNLATWAESALGFCVGCWMWNTLIAPRIGQQACHECKL